MSSVDQEQIEILKKQMTELKKQLNFMVSNPGSGGGSVSENFKLKNEVMKEIARQEVKLMECIERIRDEVGELKGPVDRKI